MLKMIIDNLVKQLISYEHYSNSRYLVNLLINIILNLGITDYFNNNDCYKINQSLQIKLLNRLNMFEYNFNNEMNVLTLLIWLNNIKNKTWTQIKHLINHVDRNDRNYIKHYNIKHYYAREINKNHYKCSERTLTPYGMYNMFRWKPSKLDSCSVKTINNRYTNYFEENTNLANYKCCLIVEQKVETWLSQFYYSLPVELIQLIQYWTTIALINDL